MEAIAIGALVGGTALSATSQVMQGREQSRAAAFESEQLRINEQMTRTAAAQDEAQRRDELTSSLETIQAIRAGRGVGSTSPTGMATLTNITDDAERDVGVSRFNLLQRADISRRSALLSDRKARTSLLAGYLGAASTVADAGFRGANIMNYGRAGPRRA